MVDLHFKCFIWTFSLNKEFLSLLKLFRFSLVFSDLFQVWSWNLIWLVS